jgi:hypothetical protein
MKPRTHLIRAAVIALLAPMLLVGCSRKQKTGETGRLTPVSAFPDSYR